MMLEQRTLSLIPIPFTNLESIKKRPVIIISNSDYNDHSEDILVMGITSNIESKKYSLPLDTKDLESGYLSKSSIIRVDKIYSLKKTLILKTLGKVKEEKFIEIINRLNALLSE